MPDEPVTPEPAPDIEAAPEPEPEPTDSTAVAESEPAPDEWGNWLYTGPGERCYSNVPVTVTDGAVITWHTIPATDGAWQPTDEEANTLPDNHRPDPTAPTEEPEEG